MRNDTHVYGSVELRPAVELGLSESESSSDIRRIDRRKFPGFWDTFKTNLSPIGISAVVGVLLLGSALLLTLANTDKVSSPGSSKLGSSTLADPTSVSEIQTINARADLPESWEKPPISVETYSRSDYAGMKIEENAAEHVVGKTSLVDEKIASEAPVKEEVLDSELIVDTSDYFEVEINQKDFFNFGSITTWLDGKNLDSSSSMEELSYYLPQKIRVRCNPLNVQGGTRDHSIGADTMGGYVVFAMQNKNNSGYYSSSFTVVMDMRGNIKNIEPTMHNFPNDFHFISLKPFYSDPSYFIGGLDIAQNQDGPVYLWNWDGTQEKKYVKLLNGSQVDCHDVTESVGEGAAWMTSNGDGFKRMNLRTGEKEFIANFPGYVQDPNHVQMVDDDTIAIVSSRMNNAIVKVNVTSSEIIWIAGGPNGTLDLIDEKGRQYEAGSISLWSGQHNVEYFGEDEYYLFDDGTHVFDGGHTKVHNSSRLMIVKVDEAANTAHISWMYDLGVWTPIYGDNDRLPSGNALGALWTGQRTTKHFDHQAQIIEVTQEGEMAWEMNVYGNNSWKAANTFAGWMIYSAERIYDAPLVSRIVCTDAGGGIGLTLSFVTHNSFKQTSLYDGKYAVYNSTGHEQVNTGFKFKPFWRDTMITVDLPETCDCTGTLHVTNQYGVKTKKTLQI